MTIKRSCRSADCRQRAVAKTGVHFTSVFGILLAVYEGNPAGNSYASETATAGKNSVQECWSQDKRDTVVTSRVLLMHDYFPNP